MEKGNLRIGFDAKRAFNNTSGLGNYSRFVISSLVKQFPEQTYVLFTPKKAAVFGQFLQGVPNVDVVAPANSLQRKLASLWRTFGISVSLRKHPIDIYHGLSNELPYGLFGFSIKRIVTIHDLIFIRYPELYKPLDRLIYLRKVKDSCRQAHKIVAISEQTKTDLIDFLKVNPAKIEVIYQDCDPVFHRPVPAHELERVKEQYQLPEKYILSVGTLEPRKNQLQLLKAWHQSGLTAQTEVVFVGRKTDYALELGKFISDHNLHAKVHFLPYIPFQDLPAIYQLAQLFVYPSVFEGFGIPIVEALNSGVPVITSTGSCFSEAGGPDTIYVAPDDTEALADAIQKVLQNPDLQKHMTEAGRRYALRFRPERTASHLQALYKEVLQK